MHEIKPFGEDFKMLFFSFRMEDTNETFEPNLKSQLQKYEIIF